MIFRAATQSDIEMIHRLVNSAYRGESSKKGWTTEADILDGQRTDPKKLQEMMEEQYARIELMLDDSGVLMGTVFLRKDGESCYLGMLTVNPDGQGKGIGKLLMDHSEVLAKSWGCSQMRMTVIHLRSELIAYYERRGYVLTGAFEPFPEDDPRFGIPKVKGMRLVEMVKKI
jgi:GNAT superfamily N-acetyltransferase